MLITRLRALPAPRRLTKASLSPFDFFVNVNRLTLLGQMGLDDANREASQGVARSGLVPYGFIRSQRDIGERHHGNARNRQQLDEGSTRSEAERFFPPLGAHLCRHP